VGANGRRTSSQLEVAGAQRGGSRWNPQAGEVLSVNADHPCSTWNTITRHRADRGTPRIERLGHRWLGLASEDICPATASPRDLLLMPCPRPQERPRLEQKEPSDALAPEPAAATASSSWGHGPASLQGARRRSASGPALAAGSHALDHRPALSAGTPARLRDSAPAVHRNQDDTEAPRHDVRQGHPGTLSDVAQHLDRARAAPES
jgi:hypothetical protein